MYIIHFLSIQFLALGTHWGVIYILDHCGNNISSRELPAVSIRLISLRCSHQCLSQDLDFSQKRSYLIFLGSYLQKRGVIHSQRKLRDKARKLRERVRSLYILHAQNTKIVAS